MGEPYLSIEKGVAMKKLFAILLTLATAVSLLPAALTASAAEATPETPTLIITEVCFNPSFKENDVDLSNTEDVTEYVEVYNPTDADVSVADCVMQYTGNGFAAESYSTNRIVTVSDNPRVIKPGETAVFVCYQASSATLGYGYASDEEIKAYYGLFCELYGCADDLPLHSFYVIPRAESGTGEKIAGGFNLSNSHTEALLRLARGEEVLAQCLYNAELWNKNNTGVNMMWHEGMDPDHPLTSMPLNTAGCNPGRIYANQVPNPALTAPADAVSVKVMEYNVRADAQTQTAADGSTVTDEMRTARIYEVIASHDPDVLALPEVNYRWLELMDGALYGEGTAYSAYGRSGSGKYHDGKQQNNVWDLTTLILWRTERFDLIEQGSFWCSKVPNRQGSANWDGGLVGDMPRAINWVILEDKETKARFLFAAAHLDAKSGEIRALSAELIKDQVGELAQGLPVIVTGDFNCSDNSVPYANIHGDTLYDARYLVPTYGSMTVLGTYNKFGENTDIQVRLPIDLCFVSRETVWVESAIMDCGFADAGNSVYASDHNATVYALKLQNLRAVDPETEETADTPAEPVTNPVTDPAAAPDGTEEPTAPETPTADSTDTSDGTNAPDGGCASSLPLLALLLPLPAARLMAWKKRREEQ